jgi:hypothetical protein
VSIPCLPASPDTAVRSWLFFPRSVLPDVAGLAGRLSHCGLPVCRLEDTKREPGAESLEEFDHRLAEAASESVRTCRLSVDVLNVALPDASSTSTQALVLNLALAPRLLAPRWQPRCPVPGRPLHAQSAPSAFFWGGGGSPGLSLVADA